MYFVERLRKSHRPKVFPKVAEISWSSLRSRSAHTLSLSGRRVHHTKREGRTRGGQARLRYSGPPPGSNAPCQPNSCSTPRKRSNERMKLHIKSRLHQPTHIYLLVGKAPSYTTKSTDNRILGRWLMRPSNEHIGVIQI